MKDDGRGGHSRSRAQPDVHKISEILVFFKTLKIHISETNVPKLDPKASLDWKLPNLPRKNPPGHLGT